MTSFKHRIVFGFLFLSVFNSFLLIDARFNLFRKRPLPLGRSTSLQSIPSTSRTLNLQHQRPSLSSSSFTQSSMVSVDLHNRDSLLTRSSSNIASLPVEVRESLHRHAAATLNSERAVQPSRLNTALTRLRPSPENVKTIIKYVKNTALGAAGVGGVAVIVDKLLGSADESEEKDENSHNLDNLTTPSTITISTERINPIGV